MRCLLVKWVTEHNMHVKEASRKLNMKYQTAKSIMRRFVKTGRVERCNKILKRTD
jgi:transposase